MDKIEMGYNEKPIPNYCQYCKNVSREIAYESYIGKRKRTSYKFKCKLGGFEVKPTATCFNYDDDF